LQDVPDNVSQQHEKGTASQSKEALYCMVCASMAALSNSGSSKEKDAQLLCVTVSGDSESDWMKLSSTVNILIFTACLPGEMIPTTKQITLYTVPKFCLNGPLHFSLMVSLAIR
jgi:hypothetical protein